MSILARCRTVWASRQGDARYPLQIVEKGDALPALEERLDGVALALAYLEREQAARFERDARPGDEPTVDIEASLAGEESSRRFVVADLPGKRAAVRLRDVGGV